MGGQVFSLWFQVQSVESKRWSWPRAGGGGGCLCRTTAVGSGREAEEVQGRGRGGMSWHLIYLPENLAWIAPWLLFLPISPRIRQKLTNIPAPLNSSTNLMALPLPHPCLFTPCNLCCYKKPSTVRSIVFKLRLVSDPRVDVPTQRSISTRGWPIDPTPKTNIIN